MLRAAVSFVSSSKGSETVCAPWNKKYHQQHCFEKIATENNFSEATYCMAPYGMYVLSVCNSIQ